MDNTQEDLKSDGSPFKGLEDQEAEQSLNNACLLNDSALLFDDPGTSHDSPSFFIPETPSPITYRRKYQRSDQHSGTSKWGFNGSKSENMDEMPGYLHTTPHSQRTLKRRRFQEIESRGSMGGNGFVPASSLLPSGSCWFESPRSPPSTLSSATCTASTSAGASGQSMNFFLNCSSETSAHSGGHGRKNLKISKEKKEQKHRKKNPNHGLRSSRSSTATAALHGAQEESHMLGTEQTEPWRISGSVNSPPCEIQEEIVIIDEDEDNDVVVEAMVRSIQMAEDEAFARSLQEQFDREEQMQQEQRRSTQPTTHNHLFDPLVGLGWISPWASMVNSSSFRNVGFTELQQAMFDEQTEQGRPSQGRRTRNPRRRQTPNMPLNLFDDSQGNNYEALLEFEERQGAAVAKNCLTKEERERLPTKVYDPKHSAGKTDCKICFCDYKKGEMLRMLPCLHDYHKKCIDRWLKDNSTCPICRADVSACGDFA